MVLRQIKPLEELEFTDDYMFGAVMKDPAICKGVIERLLQVKVDKIEYPEQQKVPGVRLNIYVQDSDRVLDVEIQMVSEKDIAPRMRYYQAIMDANFILTGQHYSN